MYSKAGVQGSCQALPDNEVVGNDLAPGCQGGQKGRNAVQSAGGAHREPCAARTIHTTTARSRCAGR